MLEAEPKAIKMHASSECELATLDGAKLGLAAADEDKAALGDGTTDGRLGVEQVT